MPRPPHRHTLSGRAAPSAQRESPSRRSSPHPRDEHDDRAAEHKVAGENACRALFAARPHDVRRVYVTEATLPRFKDVLRFCAEHRIAYHVKTDDDLDQVAETVHHDGVLFIARRTLEPSIGDLDRWLALLKPGQAAAIVLLENVKNPHNLGAILRVCAHFGVPWVVRAGDTPAVSPAVMRTAEGGAEHCRLVHVDDAGLEDLLAALRRQGVALLATSSHATVALGRQALPPRSLVMFGSEGDGLSRRLADAADDVIAIPGSGALESLNVACAASVVLWELWRGSTSRTSQAGALAEAARRGGPRSPQAAGDAPPRRDDRPGRSGGRRGGRRG